MLHPKDKIKYEVAGVPVETNQTNAEVQLSHLSPEVLRDLARNESASKEWRKAAVELLILKDHPHAHHPELRELVLELRAEEDARAEVASLAAQHNHDGAEVSSVSAVECFICGKEVQVENPDPEALYMCPNCEAAPTLDEQPVIDLAQSGGFVETVPSTRTVSSGFAELQSKLEASDEPNGTPKNPSES